MAITLPLSEAFRAKDEVIKPMLEPTSMIVSPGWISQSIISNISCSWCPYHLLNEKQKSFSGIMTNKPLLKVTISALRLSIVQNGQNHCPGKGRLLSKLHQNKSIPFLKRSSQALLIETWLMTSLSPNAWVFEINTNRKSAELSSFTCTLLKTILID